MLSRLVEQVVYAPISERIESVDLAHTMAIAEDPARTEIAELNVITKILKQSLESSTNPKGLLAEFRLHANSEGRQLTNTENKAFNYIYSSYTNINGDLMNIDAEREVKYDLKFREKQIRQNQRKANKLGRKAATEYWKSN